MKALNKLFKALLLSSFLVFSVQSYAGEQPKTMSTNIHLKAARMVIVKSTLKEDLQIINLSLWQTPTEITENILHSGNPQEAYFEWVRSISEDQSEPIYAEDDPYGEKDPVDYIKINQEEVHIQKLRDIMKEMQEEGYEFIWEGW